MAPEAGTAQRPRSVCMSVRSVMVLSVRVVAVCCVTPLSPWLLCRISGPEGYLVCSPLQHLHLGSRILDAARLCSLLWVGL